MACLDSCFIIDFIKGESSTKPVIENLKKNNETITIASPTIIELIKGLKTKNVREGEKEKINRLISLIKTYPLDKQSAILAGNIDVEVTNKGELIDLEDIMIASIAITNNERLVTKNEKHFSRIKELEVEGY